MITRDSYERTREHRGASNGDHQQRQQLGRHHTHKSSREIVDSVFADHAQGQDWACVHWRCNGDTRGQSIVVKVFLFVLSALWPHVASPTWSSTEQVARPATKRFHPSDCTTTRRPSPATRPRVAMPCSHRAWIRILWIKNNKFMDLTVF